MRLLLNLIWLVFGGLVMALAYALVALVMFVLIITIPFGIASARIALGLANFKLIPVSVRPLGRDIVDIDEVRRHGAIGDVTVGRPPPGYS